MAALVCDIRFTPESDIPQRDFNVRFGPQADSCVAMSKPAEINEQETGPLRAGTTFPVNCF
jgi:hypothetical protein